MKHILVPCDFSNEATEAYKFALDLAAVAGLEVKVIYTIDLPVMTAGFDVQAYTFAPEFQNDLKENAYRNFNNLKTNHAGSTVVTFAVIFDSIAGGVKAVLEKGNVEMIVMGTKGSNGLDEVLFGSNTEKVVRFSSVPVLAIKTAPEISSIRNIVFPNRLTLDQNELVSRVIDLQKFFNARLSVLWVNTPIQFLPDSEIRGMMKDFAHHYKLENYSLEVFNDVEQGVGILNYAHQIGADMIAMGTSARRGLAHLLLGSVAEDVVNHVQSPIWTFSTRK